MQTRQLGILLAGLCLLTVEPRLSFGQTAASSTQQITRQTPPTTIALAAGTRVDLAMISPVWAKTAQVGDPIYARTVFPVAGNGTMALPPGTYVQGQIEALKRPSAWSSRAEFQIRFSKLVFANGYTVELGSTSAPENGLPAGSAVASANVLVNVSKASDILLDNGTQFEMVLQTALSLDAKSVAAAVKASVPLPMNKVQSATKCRPVPATPGTDPTIIPGTPATPGTPDTVIPGGPGMPDTVIPGIPGTPGTPDTVIGGSSGSPGISCPGPPVVISSLSGPWDHTGKFQLGAEVTVAGQKLVPGSYEVVWQGLGPQVQASILYNEKEVARVAARVVSLKNKAREDTVTTVRMADGTVTIESLQFHGEEVSLNFDSNSTGGSPPGKS